MSIETAEKNPQKHSESKNFVIYTQCKSKAVLMIIPWLQGPRAASTYHTTRCQQNSETLKISQTSCADCEKITRYGVVRL
jgi:hypothetical protein